MVTEDLRSIILEETRKALLEGSGDPMSVVIKTVFSHSETRNMDWEELDSLINKTFLITKGKLGILDPLQEDEEVTEIMVNGKDKIFYERNGKIE